MITILFVCDTATSLSPLACGLLRHLASLRGLSSALAFEFAGVYPGNTSRPPDRLASECAEAHGFSLGGLTSCRVDLELLNRTDLVVAMKEDQFWQIKEMVPGSAPEVQLFTEYSGQMAQREIPDPLLGEADYEDSFEWIERCAEGLLSVLETRIAGTRH